LRLQAERSEIAGEQRRREYMFSTRGMPILSVARRAIRAARFFCAGVNR